MNRCILNVSFSFNLPYLLMNTNKIADTIVAFDSTPLKYMTILVFPDIIEIDSDAND